MGSGVDRKDYCVDGKGRRVDVKGARLARYRRSAARRMMTSHDRAPTLLIECALTEHEASSLEAVMRDTAGVANPTGWAVLVLHASEEIPEVRALTVHVAALTVHTVVLTITPHRLGGRSFSAPPRRSR
eukprot:548850-Prorocentrum_minimum.AAC.1